MKKLFLTTAIILSFVIGSNAQQNTGGLIKRGGDRMTRDDEAGLFLPGDGLHGIGGNADATDTYYDDNEYDWQSHIVIVVPELTVNPTSLSSFQYTYGGPSATQSFTVTGSDLSTNVMVTAPQDGDFEISLNTSGVYSNSCSITPTGGSVSSTVYVRMKANLSTGSHTGTLTVACGTLSQNIALSGTVRDEIIWNQPTEWPEGGAPVVGEDVTIPADATVIIPNGCNAIADSIIIEPGGQIIIEPGGQLQHSNEIPVTLQLDYESGLNANAKDGEYGEYRLIASPITPNVTVSSTGLVPDINDPNYNYVDLYYFDQAADSLVWINYKDSANNFGTLDINKGYLYSNAQNVMGLFAGNTLPTNNDVTVALDYTEGKRWAGWNLVGNPFTCMAYIDRAYYLINGEGNAIAKIESTGSLEVFEGVFVVATAEEENPTVTFTTTAPGRSANLALNLSNGNNLIDRAIVRFDEGRQLPKFQLNANSTKVYIPQDGEDYAVVNATEMGEMPVSFKAESNGTYTMDFTAEEVSFNYLHLIDNMTGNNVDLLATPSYTFEANTTDCANRFKLVFALGTTGTEENFAFFSNGSFVINNEGMATLQVIDVTGCIVKSESINGCANVNVNAAPGVYMLRLVNGDSVMVQKVVVR